MRLLIWIVSLFITSFAIVDKDWSFQQMCEFYSGAYVDDGSDKGQTCTLSHQVATSTEKQADAYCKENIPFHIISATPLPDEKRTQCEALSTLVCGSGWVQMFGRCYRIKKEMMTYSEAKAHCEGQKDSDKRLLNASIAFLQRPSLISRWREYFTSTSRIWLDASVVYTEDLIVNKGPHMMLAYDGYPFSVPNGYLLRVAETEKAMVLCEYTPPMTMAESNYLMKRYNQIYYPSFSTSEGTYARSASSRNRDDQDSLADSKYCEKVLSPFLKAIGAQTAIPTEIFKEAVTREQSPTVIRTSIYSRDAKKSSRDDLKCTRSQSKDYGMHFATDGQTTLFSSVAKADSAVWRKDKPSDLCDGGSWSTGFSLSRPEEEAGLEDMSDARMAPIYCQTRFETRAYGNCPTGYTEFKRSDGQKWCHKFYPDRVTMAEAEKKCAADDAVVGGWSNQDEMRLIDKLASNSSAQFGTNMNIWLGARRRQACVQTGTDTVPGYDPNESSPCSRKRVFEWINGVATNPPDFLTNWIYDHEPNFLFLGENCVVLLKGTVTNWGSPVTGDHKINDVRCSEQEKHYVLCGREAPIIVTTPDMKPTN